VSVKTFSTPAEPSQFVMNLKSLGMNILGLAYESGPTGYELAWECQQAGIPVIVAAASKIPRAIASDAKNDRLDAQKLAEYLSKGMLKPIYIPTREEFAFRDLERTKQDLIHSRMQSRQKIKSFLLRNHIQEPENLSHWSKSSVEALLNIKFDQRPQLIIMQTMVNAHEYICSQIKELENAIAQEAERLGKKNQVDNLKSIPGVGPTIAHTYTTEIFNPERFERAEEICAYVGLAPIISQSGKSKGKASLVNVGQNYLRSRLVESAWILVKCNDDFKKFYNRIRAKSGLAQKAITAVARKLLILMWRISVENRKFVSNNAK